MDAIGHVWEPAKQHVRIRVKEHASTVVRAHAAEDAAIRVIDLITHPIKIFNYEKKKYRCSVPSRFL